MENNNNAAANSNVNTEVNNNPAGADAGTEKTFTQEEVNNIVQERLARERAKNEPTPAELREKELTARENKMSCKEYIAEQKYPSELLELFDTADMEQGKCGEDEGAVSPYLHVPWQGASCHKGLLFGWRYKTRPYCCGVPTA